MNAYTLYWKCRENSWVVMLALEYKKLDYQVKYIGCCSSKAHAKAGSRCKKHALTRLQHGETQLEDTLAILAFLDASHPEKPIFGQPGSKSLQIWQQLSEIIHTTVKPIDEMLGMLRRNAVPMNEKYFQNRLNLIISKLNQLDRSLHSRQYITSNRLSAADIYLYPSIATFEQQIKQMESRGVYAEIKDIFKRMKNLTRWKIGVEKTIGMSKVD